MIESGIVNKRDVKTGNTDGKQWQRISVEVNGKTFSSFNPLDAMVNKGDNVEIEYDQKGKYNNIKTMTIVQGGSIKPASSINESNKSNTGLHISRMAAINSAIGMLEFVAKVNPEKARALIGEVEPIEAVLDIASKLQSWVFSEEE